MTIKKKVKRFEWRGDGHVLRLSKDTVPKPNPDQTLPIGSRCVGQKSTTAHGS